jgi:hypothetical protein
VPDEKIRVARINCSVEKALMTRFGVNSFPSFFLVSGWDVYEFSGKRSQTSLQDFARGGYKKKIVRTANQWQQSYRVSQSIVESNLYYFGASFVLKIIADSVHELTDGPHGIDAGDSDLCWNEGHGSIRVHA